MSLPCLHQHSGLARAVCWRMPIKGTRPPTLSTQSATIFDYSESAYTMPAFVENLPVTMATLIPLAILAALALTAVLFAYTTNNNNNTTTTDTNECASGSVPLVESVNYHFTRKCNYGCKHCFHTDKFAAEGRVADKVKLEEAKAGLALLKESGLKKLNFSGGEPFLAAKFLGDLVEYAKVELGIESVSVVTNGSLCRERWFQSYGSYLDILALSIDSFCDETNERIGRIARGSRAVPQTSVLAEVRELCYKFDVRFKINTVVTADNVTHDMTEQIRALKPFRWKVFQCLVIEGENAGGDDERDATGITVTDEQFAEFVERHASLGDVVVPEGNATMRNSYYILDEKLRFLDNREGSKKPTASILDVGVEQAARDAGFDAGSYLARRGRYEWTKDAIPPTEHVQDIEDLFM